MARSRRRRVDFHPILERNDVDAVIIGTPDHWHAIPFVYACMAGKDVYCEKPICHNIKEGRAMVNAARRYKRVSQIGTQQRSGEHFQKAVKLVQDGKLGRISLTRTWNFSNEAPYRLRQTHGPATRLPKASITIAGSARLPSGRSTGLDFTGPFAGSTTTPPA